MKKLISFLMLFALIVSCSSDDDNKGTDKNDITFDTKQIKKIELVDITNGQEKPFGQINFKYDMSGRLINVKRVEADYVSGDTISIKETMFSYDNRKITYKTMVEEDFSVSLHKGYFALDSRGVVEKGEVNDEKEEPCSFTYKYDDGRLQSTHTRTRKYISKTSMEWMTDNISLFEWVAEDNDTKDRLVQYERVDYTNYYNNASIDLARLICFGYEGGIGVSLMCGTEEGCYLDIIGKRVKSMPLKMTEQIDKIKKVVKDFDYSRDPNNRIYEIKVRKVSSFYNGQTEEREYKYLIGY